jgi:hypothetical protein
MKTYNDYLKAYDCTEIERKYIKSNFCRVTGLGVNMDVSSFAIRSVFKVTRKMTDSLTLFLSTVLADMVEAEAEAVETLEYEPVIKSEDTPAAPELPNALDPETSKFYTLAEQEIAAGVLYAECQPAESENPAFNLNTANSIDCGGYGLGVIWKHGKAAVTAFGGLYMLGASGVYQHIREVPNHLLNWLNSFTSEGALLDAIYSYENQRTPRALFA